MIEELFLIHMRSSWSVNIGKRIVKSLKFFNHTGLACNLMGVDYRRLAEDHGTAGNILEILCIRTSQAIVMVFSTD